MFPELENLFIYCHFANDFANTDCLSANELELTKGFSDKRLSHFCTGRFSAKEAYKKISRDVVEILRGSDGEPIWPIGVVGSISHHDELAGAVVTNNIKIKSVGLDIEKIGRVKREIWDLCFTKAEQAYLSALDQPKLEFYTTLFFSLKESFYKMQYPITQLKIWFLDVEFDISNGSIMLQVLIKNPELESLSSKVEFTHSISGNCVVSCCYYQG